MTNIRPPFIGSGRLQEGGALATRKQDFNSHWQGGEYNHTADQIIMNPALPNLAATNVQQTLQDVATLITSNGTGFISIGNAGPDGYDGYALGVYNVNTVATPTLKDTFDAAFADPRLQNGGVILLLAGTYTTSNPIEIPPGITLMGETAGTLIIGEMIEQSMFIIDQTVKNISVGGNSGTGSTPLNTGSGVERTRFINLMLSDNLNGTVANGGSSMSTVPMISVKIGANFECQNVSFIGMLNNGSVTNRIKTLSAIGMITGGSNGSNLHFNNCFFDAMQIAINFNSMLGDRDYLVVSNCKARTYGTEGTTGISSNTFIYASLCNLNVSNNYYLGAGTITNTFLTIGVTGGTTNARMIVTGNTGSPSTLSLGSLVQNTSGVALNGLISGNNWGNDAGNPWFITVGGGNGAEPLGDLFGSGAVDLVFKMANNGLAATVVVNPGIYNITGGLSSDNFANLKFIGNKSGKNYPVFNLNLTDTTQDSLGNKFLVFGNQLKSIQFKSTGSLHSIIPSFGAMSSTAQSPANFLNVEDCIFTDTSLHIMDIGPGPFTDSLGNPAKLHIDIEECDFRQTGAFNDSVSLLVPRANSVKVSNCNFTGYGYAISLGTNTYSSANIPDVFYLVEDTTFDLTNFGIRQAPPSGVSANYISITDVLARVSLKNCQILCDSSLSNTTPINSSLTSAGTFTKFIYVGSSSLEMTGCLINGPAQTFTSAGTFVMPSLFVEALNHVNITNTRFVGGALPLQLGGTNFTQNGSVDIQNCEFLGNDVAGQFTQLDIDFNLILLTGNKPSIKITNNIFEAQSISDIQVKHTNAVGSFYNAHGIVQIYAGNTDVVISNNKVAGTMNVPTGTNPYTHFSGIAANTYDLTSDSGFFINTLMVHDNNVALTNSYSGTSSQSATALYLRASDIKVHDNYLHVYNAVAPSNFVGCLYVDSVPTAETPVYSNALVSGNSFSRRTPNGQILGNFVGGFVITSPTSGKGQIVNNSFSDPTIDGNTTSVVLDQTSGPNKWFVAQNKNQTETFGIRGNLGRLTNTQNFFIYAIPTILGGNGTNPVVEFADQAYPNLTLNLLYSASGTTQFYWMIPLYEILPKGVTIISATITGASTVVMTSALFSWSLSGTTPGPLSGTPSFSFQSPYVANSSLTSTIVPGNTSNTNTYINVPSEALSINIVCSPLQNNASSIINLTPIVITYRW